MVCRCDGGGHHARVVPEEAVGRVRTRGEARLHRSQVPHSTLWCFLEMTDNSRKITGTTAVSFNHSPRAVIHFWVSSREQRVTGLVTHILIGVSVFLTGVLKVDLPADYKPRAFSGTIRPKK